jgi:membrane glycosyltransferase
VGRKLNINAWLRAASVRRIVLLFFILATTFIATSYMAQVLPYSFSSPLRITVITFFAILFAWISVSFWTAMIGFLTLLKRYDRFAVTRSPYGESAEIQPDARTAILFPICNEEVDRIFAGLYATYQSLEQTGQLDHFDFFVLSDTKEPDVWVEEEAAWANLCESLGALNKIFYRHRKANIKRKSGNVADFCRRWGRNYKYMIVFDADSIMSGPTLVRIVQLMEHRPDIGILQTLPMAVNRDSLIGRLQQFANHIYGPMFAAGLHFWQLGDAHYWGHNAIIRVEPFMKHCALPQLPGKPPLGGDILSHDFVEAALMRRAGFGIWLAYDLVGSYEEVPPTLLNELKRDRRWCQGNLQHLRLVFTRGFFPAHRVLFLNGAMAYISGLLWFLFLSLSTIMAVAEVFYKPNYFPTEHGLFPEWPIWHPGWALTLLGSTAIILLLPKLFSFFLITVKQRRTRQFGGLLKLWVSLMLEVLFSALLAPIRMLFHSKFVFLTLLGRQFGWHSPQRDDRATSWFEAFRFHSSGMILALIWGGAMFVINRSFFWWLTPILVALVISVPMSVWISRAGVGRMFRKLGLFLTPEEINPPQELLWLQSYLAQQESSRSRLAPLGQHGFARAVVDPQLNALHVALLRKQKKVSWKIAMRRQKLVDKVLEFGPNSLSSQQKIELLHDQERISSLHDSVWELSEGVLAELWGLSSSLSNLQKPSLGR